MLFVVITVCAISFASEVQCDVCCVPDQYQSFSSGMFGSVKDGQPNLVNAAINSSYDFANERTADVVYLNTDLQTVNKLTIADYKKGKQYTIVGSSCTTIDLTSPMMRRCIPDNADFNGAFFYGIGSKTLAVNSYSIPSVAGFSTLITVTQQTCVPVNEVMYGIVNKVPTMEYYAYFNMTLGIKDPSVFYPPASCTKQGG